MWYRQGTVSINNGSAAVTGITTSWINQAKAEDRISFDGGGKWYEILSVNSNTSITLATNFAETTISGGSYAIDRSGRRWGQASDVSAMIAQLLALFPALGGAGDALKVLRANAGGTAFDLASAPGDVTAASNFGADNRLVRSDGTGKGVQASPVVVADTTGAMSHAAGGGLPIQGTNTNNSAAAGYVGEVITAAGANVSLTTATVANIASITLTPGDWDVTALGQFVSLSGGITLTNMILHISDVSGELAGTAYRRIIETSISTTGQFRPPGSTIRVSTASNLTLYLVARAVFSTGGVNAQGEIWARRAR